MRARPDNQLQELIGQIYEAAFDHAYWSRVDAAIATTFRAASAQLGTGPLPPGPRMLDRSNGSGSGHPVAPYTFFAWQRDLWERQLNGPPASCSDYCAPWCHRPEVFYVLGANFPIATLELGQLHLHRSRQDGNFEPGERSRVAALLPHLRRAMQLRKRIAQAQLSEQVSAAALDGARLAAFVVDAELTLLHANPLGRCVLEQGEVLRLGRGRLVPLAPHNSPVLARLVRTAAQGASQLLRPRAQWLRLERDTGRPPLTLTVAPLPPGHGAAKAQSLALILLRDPERSSASVRALQQLFDLTPAEAGVAQALSSSGSLEQTAQALQISPNTVKTHLRRIFDKTGTSRQGELIALILGSAASCAEPELNLNNKVIHLNDAMTDLSDYTVPTEWRQ